MDIALGVSMAPTMVRLVLVEGENADGVTIDEDGFEVAVPSSAPEQVLAAILGTREGAAEGGYQLTSTGVAWTDPAEAAMLRDILADRRIENVMLVSAFLAATALAQSVGAAIGYAHTALLLLEPDFATLAVVDSTDGSVVDVQRRSLPCAEAVTELAAMVAGLDVRECPPGGVFVVGSGIDVAPIKPALETATTLPVNVPEDQGTALARGAALAGANAPLFASSTSALAYAQDPGTGQVDPDQVALAYANIGPLDGDATMDYHALAYSAIPDESATLCAVPAEEDTRYDAVEGDAGSDDEAGADESAPERRPFLLVGSAMSAFCIAGVAALVISLAVGIRPTADAQPNPGGNIVIPTKQMPAPPPASPAPPAQTVPQQAPELPQAPPAAPVTPVQQPPPPAPAPAAPAPAPAAPAPAPVPAPAPAPVVIPVPIPVAPAPVIPHIPAPASPPIYSPPRHPSGDSPNSGTDGSGGSGNDSGGGTGDNSGSATGSGTGDSTGGGSGSTTGNHSGDNSGSNSGSDSGSSTDDSSGNSSGNDSGSSTGSGSGSTTGSGTSDSGGSDSGIGTSGGSDSGTDTGSGSGGSTGSGTDTGSGSSGSTGSGTSDSGSSTGSGDLGGGSSSGSDNGFGGSSSTGVGAGSNSGGSSAGGESGSPDLGGSSSSGGFGGSSDSSSGGGSSSSSGGGFGDSSSSGGFGGSSGSSSGGSGSSSSGGGF